MINTCSISYLTRRSCPSAQLIKHQALKMYLGIGGRAPTFFTWALDRSEWSRNSRFTPGEEDSGTHWMGPRDGLDAVE
jgi:hypothetical protein